MASKQPRLSNPSSGVFRVLENVSPDIRDFVFYIVVDSRLANYRLPEYGSLYPGPLGVDIEDPWPPPGVPPQMVSRFEKHKLCYVTPDDEEGMMRWYYAAPREEQDKYNYEYTEPKSDGEGYPRYTRTFFELRSDNRDFFDSYDIGNNAQSEQGKHFLNYGEGDSSNETPEFEDFNYTGQDIQRVPDKNLDGLFQLVIRTYEKLCDKTTLSESDRFGRIENTTTFLTQSFDTNVPSPEPPEVGDEWPAEGSGRYVIDVNVRQVGCSTMRRLDVSTVEVPTEPIVDESIDERFCSIVTKRWVDFYQELPAIGSDDPSDNTRVVINASYKGIGQSDLREYTISYGQFPTPAVSETREDSEYCRVNVHRFYDKETSFALPTIGDTYEGEVVIDAQSKDISCGDVRGFTISTAILPTAHIVTLNTDDAWCDTLTETNVDLSGNADPLPALGDLSTTHTGRYVVDAKRQDLSCDGLVKTTVTYATVPSVPVTTQSDHPDYCTLNSDAFYQLDGYTLPAQGDAYSGGVVVKSTAQDLNCGGIIKVSIDYILLPTAPRYEHREDDMYCGVEKEVYFDVDTHTTPALGSLYGAGRVLDIESADIGCGGITRYSVTSGVVPSPIKVGERTDNEQCRIRTETFVDVNDYTIPALDSAHAADPTLKVVDTSSTPLGCRGISTYVITYAVIPSPARQKEREDEVFGRVTEYTLYDLLGSFLLPSHGDIYESERVISAEAIDVNCGDLRKYVISTAAIPTAIRTSQSEDNVFCSLNTETWVDLSGYVPPLKGGLHNGSTVVDVSTREINLGGLQEVKITTGTLPSETTIQSRTDDDRCRIVTESFAADSSVYSLPALDSSHAQDGDLKVVNTSETPYGCGGIFKYDVTYAVIPSPPREMEREDLEFGRVTEYTFYDLLGAFPLPSIGGLYEQKYVIRAEAVDVNCGSLRKYKVETIDLPTNLKTTITEDPEFCQTTTETHYDLTSSQLPSVGDPATTGYVIDANKQAFDTGIISKFTVKSAVLPTAEITVKGSHELFCNVTDVTYYCLTADKPTFERGDDDPSNAGNVVVDFDFTSLNCDELTKVKYKSGSVPSEALVGWKVNEVTGELEEYTKQVIKSTEIDTYKQDVDENGVFVGIEHYGCGLSIVEQGVMKPFDNLEYFTTISYSFPPVLGEFLLYVWSLRKGGSEIYPQYVYSKHAYNGPCAARIVEVWTEALPTPAVPITLQPTPLVYSCPMYRVGSQACLHPLVTFRCDFGTSHKKYRLSAGSTLAIPATTYTDWPAAEFLAAWTCRPAYGGYIAKSVFVTPPTP